MPMVVVTMMAMLLRRAIGRAALPTRITTNMNRKCVGSYPIPPETYVWWKNRWQVPVGEIRQSVSPFQLKMMWQYFYNFPARWYWRISNWMWPAVMPCIMFFIMWQKVKADAEEETRLHSWY